MPYARALIMLGLLVVTSAPVWAQMDNRGAVLKDEGTTQGAVTIIDCTGAGIACSRSGATGTLSVAGGGSVVITEIEIDFDTCGLGAATAKYVCKATVVDAAVSATSKLLITQAGEAATGRQEDENEMDPLVCRGAPAAGQFTLYCSPTRGGVAGKYKIYYTVG